VLVNPTPENWNDAYCLILRSEPGLRPTLWMTVRAVDPEFPAQTVPGPGVAAHTRPAHAGAGATLRAGRVADDPASLTALESPSGRLAARYPSLQRPMVRTILSTEKASSGFSS